MLEIIVNCILITFSISLLVYWGRIIRIDLVREREYMAAQEYYMEQLKELNSSEAVYWKTEGF